MNYATSDETIQTILTAGHRDPFSVLGLHEDGPGGSLIARVFFPGAKAVTLVTPHTLKPIVALERLHDGGFFAGQPRRRKKRFPYRLHIDMGDRVLEVDDPYRFPPIIPDEDLKRLATGTHWSSFSLMGAHFIEMEGVAGVSFAVWAPNATRVSVVGDFNNWDGRRHVMRLRHQAYIWEIFIPGLTEDNVYMYELENGKRGVLPLKADPYGFAHEQPPKTMSRLCKMDKHVWTDASWLKNRGEKAAKNAPISIYEVHLGSWRRCPEEDSRFLTYRELADQLVPYLTDMGFTHLQVLPINEHPFYGSWGYQTLGLYAPTRRYGRPEDFQYLVSCCHEAGIGVFLDWVPGHFPVDDHGLSSFDGTHLYEHANWQRGYHPDWNTLIYNYGRHEVTNFIISSALFWLEHYHIDGLRVDAVASMIYLNYSRREGEWQPNKYGGNTNLEALDLIRRLNEQVALHEGVVTIAEESTAWPGVTCAIEDGGLGFNYKWNMGWMNDTLAYMKHDPVHRKHHHGKMTFGLVYGFDESFVLPLSHDEVVHMKGSLIGRMPGDEWRRFANLRAYFGFMWTHPGKKTLFMGGEFGQYREWNHDASLDWHLLEYAYHRGVQTLVRDLNHLYRGTPALHQRDCDPRGFTWIRVNEHEESFFAYLRLGEEGTAPVLVICNFTPVPRQDYRFGVPAAGFWDEQLNTDDEIYGGSDMGNRPGARSQAVPCDSQPHSVVLTLPPLATVVLVLRQM